MGKSKREESEQVKALKAQIKEQRRQESRSGLIEKSKRILDDMEGEYERAKEVFFAVNGARRVLKNA